MISYTVESECSSEALFHTHTSIIHTSKSKLGEKKDNEILGISILWSKIVIYLCVWMPLHG